MKNTPARTRPGLRARSSYSNSARPGGAKVPYLYPAWASEKGPKSHPIPREIERELDTARRALCQRRRLERKVK